MKKIENCENFAIDKIAIGIIINGMILQSIAKAIQKTGKSYTELSRETGIDRAVLCRVTTGSGNGSCGMRTADKLCKYLGLELVPKKNLERSRKRRKKTFEGDGK